VSEVIDADFSAEERELLLTEVKEHLPAFLHRGASEQHDPAGDVRALLNLEARDLARVIAVHECLDDAVLAFGSGLAAGLRRPLTSSTRPPEIGQSVRGPIDWGATVSRRALEAGNESLFVVRSAQRVFDIEENRTLAWLIGRLESATAAVLPARSTDSQSTESGTELPGWWQRIERLRQQLQAARRVQWLREVPAEAPTPLTLKRLRSSRSAFYARTTIGAAESVLRLTAPDEKMLTEVLAQRYFRPAETWRLFELAVALRLARALAEASPMPRKSRLLVGAGGRPFARYGFEDGSEVALIYQGWPDDGSGSLRRQTGDWHDLRRSASRPDIFIARRGPKPDAVVLELKATFSSSYLGSGLSQLLGYVAERPDLWKRRPAGWLVAPASSAFQDRPPDGDAPLWMVGAERVGDAAVARFAAGGDAEI
jgi:hypothetical protein